MTSIRSGSSVAIIVLLVTTSTGVTVFAGATLSSTDGGLVGALERIPGCALELVDGVSIQDCID